MGQCWAAVIAAGPEGAAKKMSSKGLLSALAKYFELFNDPSLVETKRAHAEIIGALAKELSARPEEEWIKEPNEDTTLKPKSKVRYTE